MVFFLFMENSCIKKFKSFLEEYTEKEFVTKKEFVKILFHSKRKKSKYNKEDIESTLKKSKH